MFSPQENVSPFDVNMACDAGYDAIIPYTNVTLSRHKKFGSRCYFFEIFK